MVNDFVKTGKVRYISRNFPLEQAHPLARKAAEAVLCANDQGKYWELHDRFFSDQKTIGVEGLEDHASAITADHAALKQCVESGKYAAKVEQDLSDGQALGVAGTPSFFIGYPDPIDATRIHALRLLPGNVPFREFQKAIDETLELSKAETEAAR